MRCGRMYPNLAYYPSHARASPVVLRFASNQKGLRPIDVMSIKGSPIQPKEVDKLPVTVYSLVGDHP